jgi:hypothetical protein
MNPQDQGEGGAPVPSSKQPKKFLAARVAKSALFSRVYPRSHDENSDIDATTPTFALLNEETQGSNTNVRNPHKKRC